MIEWFIANWPILAGALGALFGLVWFILALIPGDQGEQPGGWLWTVREWLSKLPGVSLVPPPAPPSAPGHSDAPLISPREGDGGPSTRERKRK